MEEAVAPEEHIDFELVVTPDQKEATITLKATHPLSSEDLVYVLETWTAEMRKHFGELDAACTDAPRA
jgi:hypothetical protein